MFNRKFNHCAMLLLMSLIICQKALAAQPMISAGRYHALATDIGGQVWSWGYTHGDVWGAYAVNYSMYPYKISSLNGVAKKVFAGNLNSIVLMEDGSLKGWGNNFYGQLGVGHTSDVDINYPEIVRNIFNPLQVSPGSTFSVAVMPDGSLWSWGSDIYSQGNLGLGNITRQLVPAKINGIDDVIQVAAGNNAVIALKRDGTVWAWGSNISGQTGQSRPVPSPVPQKISNLSGVVKIVMFHNTAAALKDDGTVWCWGEGTGQSEFNPQPRIVEALSNIEELLGISSDIFFQFIIARRLDGALLRTDSWLGGDVINRISEISIPTKLISFDQIQLSSLNTFVSLIDVDGGVWAFGDNRSGQLTGETPEKTREPIQAKTNDGQHFWLGSYGSNINTKSKLRQNFDCFFDFAGRSYPALFGPSLENSEVVENYYYRSYFTSNSYLAISALNSRLYYYGPLSIGDLYDLGSIDDWLSNSNCLGR